jgi:hypothetical protein
MSSSRRVTLLLDLAVVCAFFFLESGGTPGFAQASPNGVVAALERKYVITEMTPDHAEVTKDGTIMVVKRGGLYSDPVSRSLATINNNVVDGKIQPLTGTGLWNYSKSDRILHNGDRVYVLKIETKPDPKSDQLKILILTTDPMDVPSQDGQDRFASVITFKFDKGYLNDASPDDVAQAVEKILAPDTGANSGPNTASNSRQQPGPASTAPVQQQVFAPQPPPPPPAPAAPPPTITIGESSTQVLQAMGMPQQMIDLGKKKTYVYKNMKIIFVDDKVSDVQ